MHKFVTQMNSAYLRELILAELLHSRKCQERGNEQAALRYAESARSLAARACLSRFDLHACPVKRRLLIARQGGDWGFCQVDHFDQLGKALGTTWGYRDQEGYLYLPDMPPSWNAIPPLQSLVTQVWTCVEGGEGLIPQEVFAAAVAI